MSLQSDFAALAGPLAAGGAFPPGSVTTPVIPYITYFRVSGIEESTLAKNGGTDNAINTRLQIDVWATSYAQAQNIAAALKAALKNWDVENVIQLEQDLYESDTKLNHVAIDISCWHK